MDESKVARKPKSRSPAYPAISLETAIQRARQLYDKERRRPVPVATIVSHWGYASLNGAAQGAVAALKKYGLLDEDGTGEDRRASLSRLADDILVNPDEAKRSAAIREAALRPATHREIWDKYRLDLPSDQNLLLELTHHRGFTDTGAAEFVRSYRATVAYAKLGDPYRASEPAATPGTQRVEDGHDENNWHSQLGRPAREHAHRTPEIATSYAIPLMDNGSILVEGQFPITERDWNQFMAVLAAMKPGLVVGSPSLPSDERTSSQSEREVTA